MLLLNSRNKHLYPSTRLLRSLLVSHDLRLLEAALVAVAALLRPIPLHTAVCDIDMKTNSAHTDELLHEHLIWCAQGWTDAGVRGVDMRRCAVHPPLPLSSIVSDGCSALSLKFNFWRHARHDDPLCREADASRESMQLDSGAEDDVASRDGADRVHSDSQLATIELSNLHERSGSVGDVFDAIVREYRVPSRYHHELLARVRLATTLGRPRERGTVLRIQLIALSALLESHCQETAVNAVLSRQPWLTTSIIDLVTVRLAARRSKDPVGSQELGDVPHVTQIYALRVLEVRDRPAWVMGGRGRLLWTPPSTLPSFGRP